MICNIPRSICIGNHMISSAIWNKQARVNFSKTNKSARARRASALCRLWKIYKCLFIPNCTRKIMWLLINNILEKHNYNREGKSKNEFAEWHVAWLGKWHNYAEFNIWKISQRNKLKKESMRGSLQRVFFFGAILQEQPLCRSVYYLY